MMNELIDLKRYNVLLDGVTHLSVGVNEVETSSGAYIRFDDLEELFEYRVKWHFWETMDDCRPYYKETSTAYDDDEWNSTKDGALKQFKTRFEEQCRDAVRYAQSQSSDMLKLPKDPVLEVRVKLKCDYDFSQITDGIIAECTDKVAEAKRNREIYQKQQEREERITYERLKAKYEGTGK